MPNHQINITENGTTTLATAGKYCDRNVDVNVNCPDRYEEGKQAEYDAFWDAYQNKGEPINYADLFKNPMWNDITFKPKYPIETIKYLDNTFANATMMEINQPIICLPTAYTTVSQTFANCRQLKTIRKLVINENVKMSVMFSNCTELENLTIEGTLAHDGFAVSPCKKLTHDSLMSVINALKDFSGTTTTKTVTLGVDNLAKLTDAEKQIATNKGWTLA